MSDVETTPAGAEDEATAPPEVTPEDMISRGKGVKAETLEEGSAAHQAWVSFQELVARQVAAKEEAEKLTDERNSAIYELKNTHNVSFGSIAEAIGGTSSLVLYLFQRAQGLSAKEIREISERSRLAKEKFAESDPNRKSARKQTPEEKAFRKQQREALKAFLESQKASGADVEPLEDEGDDDE